MKRVFAAATAAALSAVAVSACGTSSGVKSASTSGGQSATVNIQLTPGGCAPRPATINAGDVTVNVTNADAGAVSEAELRTADLSHILGEQENLTPGLSGGFALNLDPGTYEINCPGAAQKDWKLTVKGTARAADWKQNASLVNAVNAYSDYVEANIAKLVSTSRAFCSAIDGGDLARAKVAYSVPRVYYEKIEPVAEIWGSLDTNIDGRWQNPVTVRKDFIGFHRIEQIMWEDNTLSGASSLCAGLVTHEQQLHTLVDSATYNPTEMAAGAADLISEAGTAKVTGEEERYSNTDLVDLQANVAGAQEVVDLLRPYLQAKHPDLLKQIDAADAATNTLVSKFAARPGYDDTGYVEYSTVLDTDRAKLSKTIGAYDTVLNKLSLAVSG